MNYKIVTKEAFKVLEKVEVFPVITEENKFAISDFWSRARADGTLKTLAAALAEDENHLYGICCGNTPSTETFEYSIAARCRDDCTVPTGYRLKEIPASTWIIFECVGAMPEAIQETWCKINAEFFPSSDYEPAFEMDIEDYPDGDTSSESYKCYIRVPVKKK